MRKASHLFSYQGKGGGGGGHFVLIRLSHNKVLKIHRSHNHSDTVLLINSPNNDLEASYDIFWFKYTHFYGLALPKISVIEYFTFSDPKYIFFDL